MGERLIESLLVLALGMTGVFSSLILLAAMIQVLKVVDERLNRRRIEQYAREIETKSAGAEELNDEIVAVVTAAAVATLKKPVAIRRMRLFDSREAGAWAVTGRLNIMASHAIPKRKSPL